LPHAPQKANCPPDGSITIGSLLDYLWAQERIENVFKTGPKYAQNTLLLGYNKFTEDHESDL
jgi:hypothetical protein